jgi:hypothetical protein
MLLAALLAAPVSTGFVTRALERFADALAVAGFAERGNEVERRGRGVAGQVPMVVA